VQGFGVARQVAVRGALELLAAAYLFDCAESDYKLRFKKRGRVSSRTIAGTELVPVNSEGEIFLETRAQDVDLPLRFTVRYNDAERDADVATQTAKRIAAPTATMRSANEATLDLPLTLTPAQAKAVALRQCFGPWCERTGHQWKLPWTHLDLDPGDVVTFALTGRSYVVRILEMAIGADLAIELQTVTEESASYDVTAVTSGGLVFRRAIGSPSSASRLVLADAPLLNDGDDAQRLSSGLYWCMGGRGQPAWPGGTLFESADGAIWFLAEEAFEEMAWGLPIAALGATDTPFQTDLENELIVRMVAGADRLATVTALEMLNGANQALLVDPDGAVEILQFQTVTANADGSHTLSTLLRGRRGTEGFTGGHGVASLFVLVEPETISRLLVPLTNLDEPRYYRAVGRGEALRDATTRTVTPIGRDLMPYAPVHTQASGSWGADVTLSWVRRTRIGGEMVDGGDDVPLAEDAEAYEVDILGTADGPVLRTLEVGESEAVYTTAQQAADWDVYHALTLVNPGAETGDKTGWTNELGAALVVDTDYENLSAARTGTFFFRSPSSVSTNFRDTQTVDVSGWANPIDQGNASARGRVWVNETDDGSDHGRVALVFLDADDNVLDSEEPAYDTFTPGAWTQVEAEAAIPVGTRKIKLCLDSRRDSLPFSVAFDDATLEINPGNTLTELPVVVYQISAQVDRGFPGAATVDVS
jgi:Putative phage tail protein